MRGRRIFSSFGPEREAMPKRRPAFHPSMADLLIVTLGLFGGLASYLVNPCGPEQWALVKAARRAEESMPTSSRGADRASEPLPRRAFEGGFAGVPA
jgi:hypothetical protein